MPRLIFILLALVSASACAAEPQPHWSLEFKGGRFAPALEEWSDYYHEDRMPHYMATLSYKLLRMVDVGVEGGRMIDHGVAQYPLNGTTGGRVDYELWPLQATLTLRAAFTDSQLLVPYLGGGFTRAYYTQHISGQDKITGAVDGHHLRAGLQLLLDEFDPGDTANLRRSGIEHSYLVFEARDLVAKDKTADVDLGGRSYLIGLGLEF